ncbi:MAG: metalloregulator ArsR/SmtB family transcription factor [Pseudomonadota bacterium]
MIKMLSALSQETRLGVFRLLVRGGQHGVAAGDLARHLGIPHNTLSTHLAVLTNAGLLQSRRESRSIIYSVNFEGTRNMLSFLLEDCCQGQPDLCEPVLDQLLAGCCNPN